MKKRRPSVMVTCVAETAASDREREPPPRASDAPPRSTPSEPDNTPPAYPQRPPPQPEAPPAEKQWNYSGLDLINSGAAFWQNYSGKLYYNTPNNGNGS